MTTHPRAARLPGRAMAAVAAIATIAAIGGGTAAAHAEATNRIVARVSIEMTTRVWTSCSNVRTTISSGRWCRADARQSTWRMSSPLRYGRNSRNSRLCPR